MFFLIPKNVTSEQPIALLHTLDAVVGGVSGARGIEVATEASGWDATDGRNVGQNVPFGKRCS